MATTNTTAKAPGKTGLAQAFKKPLNPLDSQALTCPALKRQTVDWEGVIMKMKHPAIIGMSVIATLACAPFEIAANAKGGAGTHSFHFGKHFRPAHHHRNFNNLWPLWGYDGLYAMPPYDFSSDGNYAEPNVVFVSQPPAGLSCQHSKEIKTVPAEGGGTREITITRC